MNYIYGYKNKINNKWYIGQTTMPLKERHRLHLSSAMHEKTSDYNCLFHQKIREYGIDNFELVILEEVKDKEQLDAREQFWIKEKNSYVKNGKGYNLTIGGQKRKNSENYWDLRCSLSKEQAQKIIMMLQTTAIPQTEIAKQFNISTSIVNQINTGIKYRLLNDNEYPIRTNDKNFLSETQIQEIILLLLQGYKNTEIAELTNANIGQISAINMGRHNKQPNLTYPIRPETNERKKFKEKAEWIKQLLEENQLNNAEIASLVSCDASCVSRINSGKNYYEEGRIYPIRPKDRK